MLGAEQVNLLPSDKPQDVYEAVAEIVRGLVRRDVADGSQLAKAVDGKISRKVHIYVWVVLMFGGEYTWLFVWVICVICL